MTFIFQVKMYFKCIYWLLIYVINIVIISTWKWHWRPCSCEVEEMAWNFGMPWTKPSCFNRSYRFFGSIRYVSPVPHLVMYNQYPFPRHILHILCNCLRHISQDKARNSCVCCRSLTCLMAYQEKKIIIG